MGKRAIVVGYHGMSNFGDDYFLQYALGLVEEQGFCEAVVVAKKGSLRAIKKSNIKVREAVPAGLDLRGYERWLAILSFSIRADALIFCAGSIFTILPERLFNLVINMVRLLNPSIKIVAIGVSIGPFRNQKSKRLVITALERFDRLIVRDLKSSGYFPTSTRVCHVRDLAFNCEPNFDSIKDIKSLGICLNPYASILHAGDTKEETERNDLIVEAVTKAFIENKIKTITIFSTCAHPHYGDINLAKDLCRKLSERNIQSKQVIYSGDVQTFREHLARCEKVIASRLHAGFFALLDGANVFQLNYAEKITEFYRGLNLKSIQFVTAYDFDPEVITEFLGRDYIRSLTDYEVLRLESDNVRENLNKLTSGVLL